MAVRRLGGRIVAFAATVALSIPLGLLTNSAWAVEDATRSDSTTQMSSTPEVVYSSAVDSKQNRTSDFDANWKFMLSDSVQAQDPAFDDSAWQQVDLPHDYSITQKYSQSNEAESAYLPGGTGWYRKSFTIDRDLAGKRIAINFDGVYMNATVWFNGVKLGTHPYGYSPFSFDLTGNAKFGGENTIVVKVENRLPSSRWYSGSGIYRDVTLTVTDGVHVIDAGDGKHQHPTQALLDLYTIWQTKGRLDGLKVGVVGDIGHSRVCGSLIPALKIMGCEVTVIAPPTLLPARPEVLGADHVSHNIDEVLPELDVVYMLRIQRERLEGAPYPSLREYNMLYGLTEKRNKLMRPDCIVCHPGPINRGVELDSFMADHPERSVILDQVYAGILTRMAALYLLLGGSEDGITA